MNECTKGDPLRAQPHATARRSRVTLGLKICGYLAGQHFNETGPVHADRLPFVECSFHGGERAKLIHGTRGRNRVRVVEIEKVKALPKHNHLAHAVTAGPDEGRVVAAGTRVCIGPREAVEIAWKD